MALKILFCWFSPVFFSIVTVVAQTDETAPPVNGTPSVIHYNRKEFNADPQMWTMCQDREGLIYVGSNNGTLIYDGEKWLKVPLPNNSSVRSLLLGGDGIVYVGGFNEFGIIRKDPYGKYQYESQVQLLPLGDRNFENVWSIQETQGHIVFRTNKLLIAITNNKAITLPVSSGQFEYSRVIDNRFFVYDGGGLRLINIKTLESDLILPRFDPDKGSFLAVLPGNPGENLLAITRQGAVFNIDIEKRKAVLRQQLPGFTTSNRITAAVKSSAGDYYLGTLTSKVISLASLEKIGTPQQLFHDLQDNTVHNLFETGDGNIWVMLNNGLDCINLSSPVTKIFDKASISDVIISKGKMYLATNQGVFTGAIQEGKQVSKNIFKNVDGIEGQAWTLQQIGDKIICSHDLGVIVLNENGYSRLTGPRGVWKVIPVRERPNDYLVCTYDGMHLMRSTGGGEFQILWRIEGFQESSRDIIETDEPGVFWICHGYKGVFRIKVDGDYKRVVGVEYFTDKNGLPSPFNINVFRWKQDIVFTTNHGIYTYQRKGNRFIRHEFLSGLLGTDKNIRQLIQRDDKTWFVQHDEAGYFNTDDPQPTLVKGLFMQVKGILNQGMECIKPINENNVLIGTREGLYSFDLKYRPKEEKTTLITNVVYTDGDNEISGTLNHDRGIQHIPYQTASLTFEFTVPDFDDKLNAQYSYMVEGISDSWSEWQDNPSKEFSLLPAGSYVFRVRARSLLGENASEATFPFRVTPVWYKTRFAYFIYTVFSAVLALVMFSVIQKRIDTVRRKTRAEEEEKRKVLELEIQHIKLEREKAEIIKDKEILEEDVILKSKELANYTMLLVRKRELLITMQEKLNDLRSLVRNDQGRQGVQELQKMITFNLQSEEHLKVFEANFERVHHEFFKQLKRAFPDLNNKELQLCAFIKMNLTNKEIASILNLSVRGVESQRYRLRKRLAMSQEEDMSSFLEKLYASNAPELTE